MSEVQPGFWSTKGSVEVTTAKQYHDRHFRDWGERPMPRPPAGLVVTLPNIATSFTEDDIQKEARKPRRPNADPVGTLTLYAVERRARGALSALRRVVEAAGGKQRLRWAAQEYQAVKRPQRGKSTVSCELADFCLSVANQPDVTKAVAKFVTRYGDLIRDFGRWSADTEYGGYVASGSMFPEGSPLPLLGNERFLWPQAWRRWAVGVYERFRTLGRSETVPPPVAFYVWAALMLTALHEHPEWPGCQLFLANRLASLRFVCGADWHRRKKTAQERIPVWAVGELLDYLALSAAFGPWPVPARKGEAVRCSSCGHPFKPKHGRERYCSEGCRKDANAARARRWRANHPK